MAETSLRIQPVLPGEDGGTGHRWIAMLDLGGHPAFDGSGETVELALTALILQFADAWKRSEGLRG